MAGRILTPFRTTAALALSLVLVPLPNGLNGQARAADLRTGSTGFRTTTLTPDARAALTAAAVWGGAVTAATGETLNVYLSSSYPQDPTTQQRWADFLAGLTHGSELSLLNAYFLPAGELQMYCGRDALACYSDNGSVLIAPGTDPGSGITAQAVVAHEYGHHVAAHRSDAPWPALDYGTKRWASYEQVCSRTATGELHPGAENANDYATNPGEAFAETFRVLNERRLALPETAWNIVTTALYPDDAALAAVLQDVTQAWSGPATTTYRGTSGNAYTIATPLDGNASVTVKAAKATRVRLQVSGASSTTTMAGGTRAVQLTICGKRTLGVRVTRLAGRGGYTLSVVKP